MYTNDVDFDKTKTTLLKQYKSHIESVFGVNVVVWSRPRDKSQNGSNGDFMSTVKLSSQFSQESLQKAKNYIESLTVEGEESERIIEKLSEEERKMLLENQNVIENQSQAVLDLIESSGEICIFGNRKNVSVAKQIIDRMREKIQKQDSYGFLTQNSIDDPGYCNYSTEKFYRGEKSTDTTQTGSNNILLTQRQDSIQTDCAPDDFTIPNFQDSHDSRSSYDWKKMDCDTEDFPRLDFQHSHNSRSSSDQKIDNENNFIEKFYTKRNSYVSHEGDVIVSPDDDQESSFSFSEMVVKSLSSSQTKLHERPLSSGSSSEDDNDEEVNRIYQDTGNRVKIEFALKLGYSESQITSALIKLGPNVGQNELLSELIQISTLGSSSADNEDDESEETFLSSEISLPFSSYHSEDDSGDLRPIVIDGSNVAMSHGNKEIFSCRGIELAVDWFRRRGHTQITVFVPQWRKETSRPDARITDQEILNQLEKDKILVFTPARRIGGKRVVCYDDRYVLKLAAENDGVVVSNDNYRDLINEKPEYKKVVEERLLMFSFVNDRFMPPDDPLGRHGPSLENFLSFQARSLENLPPSCPYGPKKCTYGNKCKYYHPERGNIPQKSVTDKLAEQTKQKIQEVRAKAAEGEKKKQIARKPKLALQRTKSLASELPADLVSDKHSVDQEFQKLSLEDVVKKDPEQDDRWKQYNSKLSEHREKLERAELEEKLRQEEELRRQKDIEIFKPFADHSRSNTPSPSSRLSPASGRPQEQFLSGHLLLAKKLSDEANDSKLRRGTDEHSYTKSPLAATHSQPVISSPQKEIPQQPQHKKLSRQYSLQGAQDPRLKRNVRPQVSFDPNMLHARGGNIGGLHGSSSSPVKHRPLDQSQFYGSEEEKYLKVTNYERESYGHSDRNYLLPESYYSQHMTLTRMQSAPEPPLREQQQSNARPMGRMMRQNSSSDTQLHIHSGEADTYNTNFYPQSATAKNMAAKQHDSMSLNYRVQNQNDFFRQSSSMGQYHLQSDPYYSQQSLSHDSRWTFPDVGFQTSFPAGQNTPMAGYQPMSDRSQEFSSLQSRGNQMWAGPHNMQTPAYGPHFSNTENPYQQHGYSSERDYNLQSQYAASIDNFSAQSRQTGVPILGAQSSQPVIQPTDPRYNLYLRLSALFEEPKVRAVMNQYPYVNNVEELCAYLIGAK